ncbi:IS1380 family transposase [Actinopolymorpha pittospori]|uniref:IS1380 family transposase n=1 Tax=Actinopolymorpha pittospori TaxID=648752 RepID=UPI00178A7A06
MAGPRLRVSSDGHGLASHAGVSMLRELAEFVGLTRFVTQALADTYRGPWLHSPGQVFADQACAIADGATSTSGIAVLRDRPQLHGAVASQPTVWRLVDRIDEQHLGLVRQARAKARERAWQAGAAPDLEATGGYLHIDFDATITIAHSEKSGAAPTWKKSFGFHPLHSYLDRPEISGGESLAGILRPGNAGSNTIADHKTLLDLTLEALPESYRPGVDGAPEILIRADAAGATYDFAAYCRQKHCEFSFSTESTPTYVGIADAVDEQLWATAIEDDGIRDGAMVFEATHCVDLSKWPQGTRLILGKERPHPGAQLQLHNTTSDGMRLTAFITDTPARVVPHQIQGLELRHRQHAHVEARIKDSGHLGLGNLPLDAFCHNQAWFEIALAAADLISWAKLLGFKDHPGIAKATPETFRYKVLHVAGKIVSTARQLYLKLDSSWTPSPAIEKGWTRIRTAFG